MTRGLSVTRAQTAHDRGKAARPTMEALETIAASTRTGEMDPEHRYTRVPRKRSKLIMPADTMQTDHMPTMPARVHARVGSTE